MLTVTVNNNSNSPIQDYVHPDDQTQPFISYYSCVILYKAMPPPDADCSDEIHSCLQTFISNTARTATILNRDNTRRRCCKQYSRQYSRQCVEADQFWSLLRPNCQIYKKIYRAIFLENAKFVGVDHITLKNCNKSS